MSNAPEQGNRKQRRYQQAMLRSAMRKAGVPIHNANIPPEVIESANVLIDENQKQVAVESLPTIDLSTPMAEVTQVPVIPVVEVVPAPEINIPLAVSLAPELIQVAEVVA